MSIPKFQGSSDDVSLSPGQAKFMYWFVGTAPILKAMTSITTYWGLRDEALKKLKNSGGEVLKKNLDQNALRTIYHGVLSDFSRQTVTCSFQLMSYFIVGDAIKGILNKIYSKKPADQQEPGFQQVLKQTIPLGVQVLATIFSRKMGAAQVESLFKVNERGEVEIPDKEKGLSRWLKERTKPLVENFLRDGSKEMKPFKASLLATSGMVGYFMVLVGALYGVSALLEKVFPGTFKSKRKSGAPAQAGPVRLNASSPAMPPPSVLDAQSSPPKGNPAQRPALQFGARPYPTHSPVSPLGYSR